MTKRPQIRLGTRGSQLALAQAHEVRRRLAAAHRALAVDSAVEIVVIKTTGDRIQDRRLAEIGGKGLFTKEIDEALSTGAVEAAVHSMKDVPTWLPDDQIIGAILPREDPRDALFSNAADSLAALPAGAVVGTSSLRRQAQVLFARPDLRVEPLRGNVDTRLRKLKDGQVDATLLAVAGVKRLALTDQITATIDPAEMLPAVAQGAIGLVLRRDDPDTKEWLRALDDPVSNRQVAAERACLEVLDGSCRTPIAAYAELEAGAILWLRALVAMPDGSRAHRAEKRGPMAEAEALGRAVGTALRDRAGPAFFAAMEHAQ